MVDIAYRLIGCRIQFNRGNNILSGLICETEAYRAPEDKASHAYGNRRTNRTEVMYGQAGTAYVYLCYGIHHLFNIVTGPVNVPHAVLIRGIIPLDGIEAMKKNRKQKKMSELTNGPGKWTSAFGITTKLNGLDLTSPDADLKLFAPNEAIGAHELIVTPRIGIGYAEEWIDKPWRFLWNK